MTKRHERRGLRALLATLAAAALHVTALADAPRWLIWTADAVVLAAVGVPV